MSSTFNNVSDEDTRGGATLLIVMGTSGSGKSSVAEALASKLKVSFLEGDDFHPIANKTKMSGGVPLQDEDRWPWLEAIRKHVYDTAKTSPSSDPGAEFIILSCSSLKRKYRELLSTPPEGEKQRIRTIFVYLKGEYEVIKQRMMERTKHFAKANLLESQFATLEEPNPDQESVVVVPIDRPLPEVIELAYKSVMEHPYIQKKIK